MPIPKRYRFCRITPAHLVYDEIGVFVITSEHFQHQMGQEEEGDVDVVPDDCGAGT